MYWCTCYNYDATIRWTWYDSNDFFGSARAYGVLGCLWWHLEISAYSESAATSRDPTRCATYIRASGGTKLRKFSNFEATALACRMSCTKFSTKISTTALDISWSLPRACEIHFLQILYSTLRCTACTTVRGGPQNFDTLVIRGLCGTFLCVCMFLLNSRSTKGAGSIFGLLSTFMAWHPAACIG